MKPCAISTALRSIGLATPPGHLPDLYMLTLFGVGAVVGNAAGACGRHRCTCAEVDRCTSRMVLHIP